MVSRGLLVGALSRGAGMKLLQLLISGVFLISCSGEIEKRISPAIIDGVVDVSDWDFDKDGGVELRGKWLFQWGTFVKPDAWTHLETSMPQFTTVPAGWYSLDPKLFPEQRIQTQGVASYAIRITGLKITSLQRTVEPVGSHSNGLG